MRIGRYGPLLWITADGGVRLQPGDFVVIAQGGARVLAQVIVAPIQLIEADPMLVPVGRLVGPASEADQVRLGREAAAALDAAARANVHCAEQGLDVRVEDCWMAPDYSRVYLVVKGALPPDSEALRLELTRLFDLPVDLLEPGPAGLHPVTGLSTAGLPSSWSEWIVPPGSEPQLRSHFTPDAPTAGEFITRLFRERPASPA